MLAENQEAVRNLFVSVVRAHFKRIFHRWREIEKLNNDWLTILDQVYIRPVLRELLDRIPVSNSSNRNRGMR